MEDLSGEDASKATPTTSHRSLKTVIIADDQQTVVLGGLMRDRSSDSESKIPFFGDLPIIGYLFKQHNEKAQKVNLLLVLTPYIINSQIDFQRIFERKMQEHEEFAAQYYGHRKEYRAHIDYSKKTGPFSRLVRTLRREHEKYENGGEGDGSEVLVGPKKVSQRAELVPAAAPAVAAAAASPLPPAAPAASAAPAAPPHRDGPRNQSAAPPQAARRPSSGAEVDSNRPTATQAHDAGNTKVAPELQPSAAGKSDRAPNTETFKLAPSRADSDPHNPTTKSGMPLGEDDAAADRQAGDNGAADDGSASEPEDNTPDGATDGATDSATDSATDGATDGAQAPAAPDVDASADPDTADAPDANLPPPADDDADAAADPGAAAGP